MKNLLKMLASCCLLMFLLISCKKVSDSPQEIPNEVLNKIASQGFGISNVERIPEGYIVEGDIILTEDFLNTVQHGNLLRAGNAEQYRTTNLVVGPRTIRLKLNQSLASKPGYIQALQEVANRYNAENLTLTFTVVSPADTADVVFVESFGRFLGSAGFPTNGNPYPVVQIVSYYIGTGTSATFINYAATILAHELGHCIGFRHTDYMNRSFSCGGSAINEGASTVGAVHIPNTPTTADAGSWMLSCIGAGVNRPFNNNDKVALSTLY